MASHFETVQTELGTVLQDAEKGAKLFEDLRKFSFETTFGVDELADASKQLLNAGKRTSELNSDLKMLGDLAGGSKQKFAELTGIYSKILTQGKAGSMQIQQLNLRGIPMTKTLQQMGVSGVASAEQLQEAFKRLTEEGGQFHDSMNNIIDTIEGKRGFITDTIKEIQVNLGEVTGLTDLYKNSLDVIYEVLNNFNNVLMKINENPFLKALVSGVVTTLVTGLVTIIGGSLVTALGTVATKLGIIAGLKAVISSPVGWIALGVAGIAGAIAGVVSYTKAHKELEVQAIKTQNALKGIVPEVKKGNTYEQNKSYAESMIQILNDNIKQYQEELETARKEMESWQTEWNVGGEDNAKEVFGITELENKLDSATKSLKKWNDELKQYNALEQAGKEIQDLGTEFDRIFGDTDFGKKQQEINAILKDIQTLKTYLGKDGTVINGSVFKFTNDTKQQINDTIAYLENKLNELTGNQKTKWQELFKEVTGVYGETGLEVANKYMSEYKKLYQKQLLRKQALGLADENTGKEIAKDFVNMIEEQINTLLDADDIDDPFQLTDKSIIGMIETMNYFKSVLNETSQSVLSYENHLQGVFMEEVTNISHDVSSFVNNLTQTGDALVALGMTLISILFTAVKNVEGMDRVLNPLTTGISLMQPLITDVAKIISIVMENIIALFPVIESIYEILQPYIKTLQVVSSVLSWFVKGILTALKGLFDIIGFFSKKLSAEMDSIIASLDNLHEEMNTELGIRDKLLEKSRDLTNEYEALISAMQENEEWYLSKKQDLNSEAYKYQYQKVNDMILTPNGNFSTHPDDYIIATKNPSGMGSVNMVVNDYAGVNVQTENVDGKILITLSQKIAEDVANGSNGWDNALATQQYRMAGRRINL